MRFGFLESYSTTTFEARLGRMKYLIRGGNKRLEQLANRTYETIDYFIGSIKSEQGENFLYTQMVSDNFVTYFRKKISFSGFCPRNYRNIT